MTDLREKAIVSRANCTPVAKRCGAARVPGG